MVEKQNIIDKLKNFDVTTNKLLDDLSHVSDEKLKQNPDGGWSVLQVLSHLDAAESASLGYMRKKLQAGDKMGTIGLMNQLKMGVIKIALKSSLKWKAPSYISNPASPSSLVKMREQWMNTRKEIKNFVSEYPDKYINSLVYKHPMGGRQDLNNAIDSFIFHQAHHIHQINRIKKKLAV